MEGKRSDFKKMNDVRCSCGLISNPPEIDFFGVFYCGMLIKLANDYRDEMLNYVFLSEMYVVSINSEIQEKAFTGLKNACIEYGINYSLASRGKRKFIVGGKFIHIKEIELVKITGRGGFKTK